MGVYVKGMKMPKECRECYLLEYYEYLGETQCSITRMMLAEREKPISFDGRPSWCPLVEVPEPHEKLVEFIDVATFEDEDSGTEEVNLGEAFAAYFKMREAKPIIEAEGE